MRLKWVLLVLVVAGAFFGGGWLLKRVRPASAPPIPTIGRGAEPAGSNLFRGVFETIRRNAVDSLDDQAIYQLATTGVLAELGDPYAALIRGRDSGAVARLGEPAVQGVYLDQVDGFVEVVAVVPGSPAAAAGIRPGDALLAVDQTAISHQRADEAARLLDGPEGSKVRVRLGRPGASGPLWVTMNRGSVTDPAPEVAALDPGVIRIRPGRIDSMNVEAVRRAVDSASPRATVLDLRGVVEGDLSAASRLADLFLDRDAVIGITRSKAGGDSTVFRDQSADPRPDLILVVLVDRATAGPGEWVAGAIQDNDRGLVVGEASYGRGAGQTLFPLGNYTVRLTTSVWVTPRGRVIQRFPEPDPPVGVVADTSQARPKFTTVGGRIVLGGGGIVPDREVAEGEEPSRASDQILALAKSLIQRAKDRQTLLAVVAKP